MIDRFKVREDLATRHPPACSRSTTRRRVPDLDGLGVQQYFDRTVIQNPELSLAGGAIPAGISVILLLPDALKSLAEHYKFDVGARGPA